MDNRFKFVCRVCLVKDSSSIMISMADQGKRDILLECTSVLVHSGDKYPQQLCTKCWNRCRDWSDLKRMAQDSDQQLKSDAGELDGENELMCGDGNDELVINLRLEEDELMCDGHEVIVKEEQSDENQDIEMAKEEKIVYLEGYSLAPAEVEEEQDPIEPLIGDVVDDGSEDEQTTGEGPAKVQTKQHKCRYCSKGLSKLSELIRHERVHTNERPFPCDECEKKFKTNSNLKQHKLFHSGVKAFKCKQCHVKFTLKGHLIRHKQSHSHILKTQHPLTKTFTLSYR